MNQEQQNIVDNIDDWVDDLKPGDTSNYEV